MLVSLLFRFGLRFLMLIWWLNGVVVISFMFYLLVNM